MRFISKTPTDLTFEFEIDGEVITKKVTPPARSRVMELLLEINKEEDKQLAGIKGMRLVISELFGNDFFEKLDRCLTITQLTQLSNHCFAIVTGQNVEEITESDGKPTDPQQKTFF